MAEPKTASTTIYNQADGPRSIIGSDGAVHVIAPKGSTDGEFHQAELDALHPDLTTDKPKGDAAAATGPAGDDGADNQARAIEELATDLARGHDLESLKVMAKADDVTIPKNAGPDQLALAIAQKRLGENK
jgi:hypothetical protein